MEICWERILVFIGIVGFIAMIWVGGACFGERNGIEKMQAEAVKAGVGQYNQQTAKFEFISK